MSRFRWPRLGLRREVQILLPIATLLLVVLSTFAVLAYRTGIEILVEDEQRRIARLARTLAADLSTGPLPSIPQLRQRAPLAETIAVVEEDGRILLSFGQPDAARVLAPVADRDLTASVALGPSPKIGDTVSGFARMQRGDTAYLLRVDLPAYQLARQRKMARRLPWIVLPINTALLLLVLLFLPTLLEPYETMLRQAQRLGQEPGDEDEISFLLSTVDRALDSLARAGDQSGDDDIASLQRALGASLESGLLLLDRDGNVLTLNAFGSRLLEIDRPTQTIPLAELLAPHHELCNLLVAALDTSRGLHREQVEIESSEGARTLGLTVHGLNRDDGTVRGHLVLFADLTESRKEAEADQLEASLAQLGELAAGVAHELRNSLATLKGYLQLIERRPEEESITDYLSELRRESNHLQRVLDDFLSFARPESRRVERVDLSEIAKSAAVDPALEGKPVRIELQEQTEYGMRGDAQLLERAMRNLLRNAAQAEAELGIDGALELELCAGGGQVEIFIRDRGGGLPDSVRDRLFQPFVTGRADGVGLGLSLTHRIVSLHGGRIELENRPDGGTEVHISFPRNMSV